MSGAPVTQEPLFDPERIDRSDWPEIKLRDVMHLMQLAEDCDALERLRGDLYFRGQPNVAYSLTPSLSRMFVGLQAETVVRVEAALLDDFVQRAGGAEAAATFVLSANDQPVKYWMRMQHHGAPTRLLDWTASLFVATYFACIDAHDHDGAVWYFSGDAHLARMTQRSAKPYDAVIGGLDTIQEHANEAWCYPFRAVRPTERMLAQAGRFTIAVNPLADHAALIHAGAEGDQPSAFTHLRIRIPAMLKPRILHRLHAMNITAGTLFPGIDGVGRSVRERAILMRSAIELRQASQPSVPD